MKKAKSTGGKEGTKPGAGASAKPSPKKALASGKPGGWPLCPCDKLRADLKDAIRLLAPVTKECERLRAERNQFFDTMRAIAVKGLGLSDPWADDAPTVGVPEDWSRFSTMSEEVAELRANLKRALDALEALLPPRQGQCWCDNPEGLGHEPKCMRASTALARARVVKSGSDTPVVPSPHTQEPQL